MSLTTIFASSPGRLPFPELLFTTTPGSTPWRALVGVADGLLWKVFLSAVETAPARFALLAVPYPMTTTSSRMLLSISRTISTIDLLPTFSANVLKPRQEASITSASVTSMLYFPSMSVIVPTPVLFWSIMLAPMTGSPLLSVTVPEIFLLCAKAVICTNSRQVIPNIFVMMLLFILLLSLLPIIIFSLHKLS